MERRLSDRKNVDKIIKSKIEKHYAISYTRDNCLSFEKRKYAYFMKRYSVYYSFYNLHNNNNNNIHAYVVQWTSKMVM